MFNGILFQGLGDTAKHICNYVPDKKFKLKECFQARIYFNDNFGPQVQEYDGYSISISDGSLVHK